MSKKNDNKKQIQTVIDRNNVLLNANIEESYIFTTEDKIHILYEEYNKARKSIGDFWTCFGVFISLITTLLTCEFNKVILGLEPSTIKAIFIVSSLVFLVLSIIFVIKWIINRKKITFDFFISKIKGCNKDR